MIGTRYFRTVANRTVEGLTDDELAHIDGCRPIDFVRSYQKRTGSDLYHSSILWNSLRIHLGYETAPDQEDEP